ncbi:unnamed protein product [Durusdinium trenchii]|uniref:Uncharacterized protein n=1 Tax=Durusdinium trenchii TaxID=1381693 RepID=A0ABP0JID6_9DINO
MAGALIFLLLSLLLAWGRRQQRSFTWVPPQPQTATEATGNEETHALVRCHPGDSQREGSLPSQVATCPPAAGVVKAMLISVLSYLLLGTSCFVACFSCMIAFHVLMEEQEAGAIGLMTFALCTFVALSGFGMVAALLATTLKHLRCQEPDLTEFTDDNAVRNWRNDALSLTEEKIQHWLAWAQDTKASWLSSPCMMKAILVLGRVMFLWDIASDVLVGLQLLKYHGYLACLVFTIVALPYLVLPLLVGRSGVKAVLTALRPQLLDFLGQRIPTLVLDACICVFAIPLIILVDVDFIIQFLWEEPTNPRLFHYWTLRLLAEVLWESNLQVLLQVYIFLRQENAFGVLPSFHHTSVSATLLTVSILSSSYSSMDGLSKLKSLADLQTQGSRWDFLVAMVHGGAGLAPSNLVQELRVKAKVEIQEDLSDLDLDGWRSICLAARYSKTLRHLSFNAAFWAKFTTDQKKIEVRNALLEIFHNPQLQELQIAELPDDYAEHVKLMRSSHPWLTEGDWQQGLRKWPQVLAAVNGDLAPLQRAPVDCDLKIGNGTLMETFAIYGQSRAMQHILVEFGRRKVAVGIPLILAASGDHGDAVELLLMANANPDHIDPQGRFPLQMAAQNGNSKAVELLLGAKANPDQINPQNGGFPLQMAAQNGHSKAVELLLGAKANPDQSNRGMFPLLKPAQDGHSNIVELLLGAKANPDQSNPQNGTFPLLQAAQDGHSNTVELLLMANANPDQIDVQGRFPLQMAAQNGHSKAVELLLMANANPDQIDPQGRFPLQMAAQNGHSKAVELLLAKANPDQINPQNGGSPLLMAAQNGHSKAVELLLKAKATPDQEHPRFGTPFQLASRNGHSAVLALLGPTSGP